MFSFLKTYQLDIMLALCSACLCFMLLLIITRFLERRRKFIMIFMEFVAACLLFFDRMAYIYSGDVSHKGYVMVRVSNFLVFFLTAAVVLGFNMYAGYLITRDETEKKIPKRLALVSMMCLIEMVLVVANIITKFFYYFDEYNVYHRGRGFAFCYVIPVVAPLLQYSVIRENRKKFSTLIYISMMLYIFVPILMALIQLFAYGVSIVNMSMVMVSISLYVFAYLDINNTVMSAHNNEMKILEEEKKSVKRLFDHTSSAFMAAVEQRDEYSEGHASRVANLSRRIAFMMGKSEDECDEIYYSALLHNVGLVSIPDSIIEKKDQLTEEERKIIERVPVLSSQILSGIVEYPYLKEAALYSHERYNGTGYPVKLKGESIPEVARIVGAADAYDAMISRRSYRGPLPIQTIREEFIQQAGIKFDPNIASILVHIMDMDNANQSGSFNEVQVEKEISCENYRQTVSSGIPVIQEISKISFKTEETEDKFSGPSIILFDSFDGYVHDNEKAIKAYHYMEYGEAWFDGKAICTDARNLQVQSIESEEAALPEGCYEITAAKFEDHMKMELLSAKGKQDVIMALPDRSKAVYIGLTGENCRIYDIEINISEQKINEGDIKRIVEADNYINRMESDVANVQINQYRSASTEAIPLKDRLELNFHTMSLPSSSLVWHCPYIVLFYSDDKKPSGESYREYAMIKINGEVSADEGICENKFVMKKKESFLGWDVWKTKHKEGLECSVSFVRKGNTVSIKTEKLGIAIENTTTSLDGTKDLYVSLSGDEVALTDIRIM